MYIHLEAMSIVKYLNDRQIGSVGVDLSAKNPSIGSISEQLAEEKATIPSKNQACDFSGQTRSTFLMAFSPDGSLMASTHGDHAVRVTDLASGKCIHTLTGHPRTPWCVAFHPVSNDILASGCLGGEVRIWDLRGGGSEVWRSDKNVSIASIAFHPSEQVLVFALANEIHFWDWTEQEPFATITTAYEYEKVRWIRFDPYGYYLYTGIGNAVNAVPVQSTADESEVRLPGPAPCRHTSEERVNLQNHYRRILDEIQQLRRERLQQASTRQAGDAAASSNFQASLDPTRSEQTEAAGAESSVSMLRPPSPVHVDALVNARMYAAAMTQAQQAQERQSVQIYRNTRRQSLLRRLREIRQEGAAMRASRSRRNLDRELHMPSINVPETSSAEMTETSVAESRSQATTSILSSFLRSRLTSSPQLIGSSTTSTVTTSGIQSSNPTSASDPVEPASVMSVHQPSTPTSLAISRASAELTSAFRSRSQASLASALAGPATSAPSTSSGSIRFRFLSYLNSTATNNNREQHYQCASGQCQICQRYPSMDADSGWNMEQRTVPILPRRVSRSTSGREGPIGQRLKRHPRKLASVLESEVKKALDQVRARRLDISKTLHDLETLREELSSHNSDSVSESLASNSGQPDGSSSSSSSMLEPLPSTSSSQLSDGNTSHQVTAQAGSEQTELHDFGDKDSHLASSQESYASLLSDQPEPGDLLSSRSTDSQHHSARSDSLSPPLPLSGSAEIALDTSSTMEDSNSMEADFNSQGSSSSSSSLGSLDSLPSSQEDVNSGRQAATTLTAIGQYSTEIRRRVQELDHRISEIQNRLQDRLDTLQQHRERPAARISRQTVPRCISISERIRQRHERLRAHLDDLQKRYQRGISMARQMRHLMDRDEDSDETPSTSSLAESSAVNSPTRSSSPSYPVRGLRTITSARRLLPQDVDESLSISSMRQARREQYGSWQRRNLHPHYSVSILDETSNRQDYGLQSAINRAIAGVFQSSGETSIASNILNTSYRIQRWPFSRDCIPTIKNRDENVIVPRCKLHNDAFCDMSKDGRFLAVFVPSHNGFPDDSILAVYSLASDSFKQCLYTKCFGPNFVSVSISPLNNYILVGLATRRLAWVFTPRQMVAQVYKVKTPNAGEDSMEHICDLMHPCDIDIRTPVSVNSARWLPYVGEGIVYGTNRGDLHICRPGFEQEEKRNSDADGHQEVHSSRPNWMMHVLGLNVPRTMSTATQTVQRVRRTASTQTDRIDTEDYT